MREKKSWGSLTARWVPHDLRDQAVDSARYWSERTGLAQKLLVIWLGIQPSKYYDWRERYGKVNALAKFDVPLKNKGVRRTIRPSWM